MKETTALDIAIKINEVAKGEGVYAEVNFNPATFKRLPVNVRVWNIELTYNNYCRVGRFNSDMAIGDYEVNRIASYLLKDLFYDYFAAKLGLET